MLKSSWLVVLFTAGFEYTWAKAWSPLIDTPPLSGPTTLLIAALLFFTLYRWAVVLNRKLARSKSRVPANRWLDGKWA